MLRKHMEVMITPQARKVQKLVPKEIWLVLVYIQVKI